MGVAVVNQGSNGSADLGSRHRRRERGTGASDEDSRFEGEGPVNSTWNNLVPRS